MTPTVQYWFALLEVLPPDQREELAHQLLGSLMSFADENVAAEWRSEIARRSDEVFAGTAASIDGDEFEEELRNLVP